MSNYNPIGTQPGRVQLIVPDELAGLRLDQALQRLLPEYSRSRLQEWIRHGHVILNNQKTTIPKQPVWGGESIDVAIQPGAEELQFTAENITLDIVFEDDALLVINKPAGLVVHPGSGNWHGTLLNALLHHAPALSGIPRAGIVHRLDKDTSGLLVIAKTLTAQTALVKQLQARTVKREYLALVRHDVKAGGAVNAPIGRHPTHRTKMAIVSTGKPATTYYEIRERFGVATLVLCRLETGRTHQIRVHMQSIGHPLAGDPVYSPKHKSANAVLNEFQRQALHAQTLALIHPQTGQAMQWTAPLPHDMQSLLTSLRDTTDLM